MKSVFTKPQLAKIEECGSMLMPLSDIAVLLDAPLSEAMQEEFYTQGTPAENHYRKGDVRFRANAAKVMMAALFSSVINTPTTRGTEGEGKRTSPRIDGTSYEALAAMRTENEKKYQVEKRLYAASKAQRK